MLATRHSLRLLARLTLALPRPRPQLRTPTLPLAPPPAPTLARTLATTPPPRPAIDSDDLAAREDYVRSVRIHWGSSLPENLLTDPELALYERHYGKPVRMLKEGESALDDDADTADGLEKGTLTLQGSDGEDIEVFEPRQQEDGEGEEGVDDGFDYISVPAGDEATGRSLLQLKADMERAFTHRHHDDTGELAASYSTGEEDTPTGIGGAGGDDAYTERTHPLTSIGRFATHPSTIRVPPGVQQPTLEALATVPNKHLDAAAERVFGSRKLPDSPVFTNSGGKALRRVLLDVEDARMSDIEAGLWLATVLPGYYAQSLSALTELRRRLGGDWALGGGGEGGVRNILDVGSGGAAVLAWRSIVEAEQARRRDEALQRAGAEPPTLPPPEPDFGGLKATVVTASEPLRYRMAKHLADTAFVPRMPDRNPDNVFRSPTLAPDAAAASSEPNQRQARKTYDLIVATHNMLPLREPHHRRDRIKKLWSHLNPRGGVLLLIEKGTPLGFEAVAGARATLLRNYISSPDSTHRALGGNTGDIADNDPVEKEPGAIIAPCTNHAPCPLFPHGHTDGTGRKDWCHFVQRYERPPYLQRVMGAAARNHDDLLYSFVAVRRGADHRRDAAPVITPDPDEFQHPAAEARGGARWAQEPTLSPYTMDQLRRYAFTLPRTLFPPIKRHGHVTLDVCTPAGTLERWTVPKSYSRGAFRDARKSRWGDLWALGGKSKTLRNVRVGGGKGVKLVRTADGEGGVEERVPLRRVDGKGAGRHWSRGSAPLGDRVKRRAEGRRETRWRAREEEMDETHTRAGALTRRRTARCSTSKLFTVPQQETAMSQALNALQHPP
ncbi:37S ribosomal protein-like protein Rsm22 [Morchella snyderi]|nr:37S ribosomal protein-like protein Rsm22 [Morchella snyderi]